VSSLSPELLAALVRIPSPSGKEEEAARFLEDWSRGAGLEVERDELGVRIQVEGRKAGPTLAFASHLDTVPEGEGWTADPFGAEIREGRLYGRGASDAKASVSSMAAAAARLAREGGPPKGRLLVLATFSEETRNTTMPALLEKIGRPPAALIGEPTSLRPCTAQRGLLILTLRWRGEQVHAGWAADLPEKPPNAIERAAADLVHLKDLSFDRPHPLLGGISITPTMIQAGVGRNLTPPECTCLLDVRTTPNWSHDEIVRRISGVLEGEVEVVSKRLRPVETPRGSRLLAAVRKVLPGAEPFGSPTASDWVWLGESDALKIGPGDSRLSHRVDECVALEEVEEAEEIFYRIAGEYLS